MDPDQDMNAIMQEALDKTVNEIKIPGMWRWFRRWYTTIQLTCAHRPTRKN